MKHPNVPSSISLTPIIEVTPIMLGSDNVFFHNSEPVAGYQFLRRYFVRYYLSVEGQQIACLAFTLRICNDDKCP